MFVHKSASGTIRDYKTESTDDVSCLFMQLSNQKSSCSSRTNKFMHTDSSPCFTFLSEWAHVCNDDRAHSVFQKLDIYVNCIMVHTDFNLRVLF